MELIKKRVEDLIPYENNPRINDGAVDAVAESIRQCGYVAPIIVDEDGVILAGHTRRLALQRLGIADADVIVRAGLTEEQKRKYRILDNKTNEFAEWDFSKLEEELADLDFGDFDFGFDESAEEEQTEIVEDEAPEVDEKSEPITKVGDIYQLGRHRLMCGDSTKLEDVERLMGGQKADLLLTDPPYNVALGMGGSVDEARKRHQSTGGLVIMNDKMENDDFRKFLTSVFSNASCVMKEGAAYYIWHADNEGYNFRGSMMDAGFQIRQTLIWKKQSITLGRQDYQWIHEPCLYGWKDGAGHAWYSDRKQSTVLCFDRPTKSELHPTMKPVALFDYQIKNSSKGGDIVLDLFGGSGTTMVACEQNGRSAYLMELDPRYADVIVKRWEQLTGNKAVKL